MKTAALIAEYNPFHNGHLYHLQETRRRTGADRLIIIMSGDFTERGCPAVLDKYTRTSMALSAGADLVLELPVCSAVSSAEFFARGGVGILDALGVVDTLSFGAESDDAAGLSRLAGLFLAEPEEYASLIREGVRTGLSYPEARAASAGKFLGDDSASSLLSSPNNILAVEYEKALQSLSSPIQTLLIPRRGDYRRQDLPEEGTDAFASASAVRRALGSPDADRRLAGRVPDFVLPVLSSRTDRMCADVFALPLWHAAAQAGSAASLTRFQDISPDLANRIWSLLPSFTGWDAFASQVKTRQFTRTRIDRALCHILLGLTKEQTKRWSEENFALYARVLGFRRESEDLLSRIKEKSRIPLITKMADAQKAITAFYEERCPGNTQILRDASESLRLDVFAAELYETAAALKSGREKNDEYRHGLILL